MAHQDVADRISIAWTEGRLENVLERQKQLLALHDATRQRSNDLIQSLQQDVGATVNNATAQLTATLDSINELYTQLDFQELLSRERALKHGGCRSSFNFPLGPTLVAQTSSSPVFSSLVPLAAALAAGNPTVVLASKALQQTNLVLAELVTASLDREAVHFEKDNDDSVHRILTQLPYAVAVLQDSTTSKSIGPLVRRKNPNVRVLQPFYGIPAGFVDRSASASVDAAVEHILSTTLTPSSGNPLRIPRLYLVDEFVIGKVKEKLQARFSNGDVSDLKQQQEGLETWLRKQYASTSSQFQDSQEGTGNGRLLPDVSGSVIQGTAGTEVLLLPTRSLDHSIDLLNKMWEDLPTGLTAPPLTNESNVDTGAQAIYIFAGGKQAFYLGNFVTASHVYINQIPLDSLAVVAARTARSTIEAPYSIEDFSQSKHFAQTSPSALPARAKKATKIQRDKVKQFQGGRVSYFEQGLVLGAAIGLFTVVGLGLFFYHSYRTYALR